MPETITVMEQIGRRGIAYYTVPAPELQQWLARIRAIPADQVTVIKKKIRRKKKKD